MHSFVGRNLSFPSQNCFKLPRLLPVLSHHGCHRKSCVHLERAVGISAPFTSERHHFHCHFKTSIFCYLSALPPCYHAYAYCVGRCRRVVVQRWGKRGSQHHFSRSAMCVWGAKERVGIQLEWKERKETEGGNKKGMGKNGRGALMRLLLPKTWFLTEYARWRWWATGLCDCIAKGDVVLSEHQHVSEKISTKSRLGESQERIYSLYPADCSSPFLSCSQLFRVQS